MENGTVPLLAREPLKDMPVTVIVYVPAGVPRLPDNGYYLLRRNRASP